nr:FAD-dependent oxidoreductase [Rappaport israeli]
MGCIPSKALLESSELFHKAQTQFAIHGIEASDLSFDLKKMLERKNNIVSQLTGGIAQLFKANKIEWIQGRGQLKKDKVVEVQTHDAKTLTLKAKKAVVLAFGSKPIEIAAAPVDEKFIVSSTGALEFQEVPKRLGGYWRGGNWFGIRQCVAGARG